MGDFAETIQVEAVTDDLISRQAAIGEPMTREEAASIIEERVRVTEYVESSYVDCVDIEALRIAIKALAQPERPKGRWIPVDSYSAFGGDEATWMAHGNPIAFYYCSECKEQAYAGEDGKSLLTDYCPDCGAYMRGEEHGKKMEL